MDNNNISNAPVPQKIIFVNAPEDPDSNLIKCDSRWLNMCGFVFFFVDRNTPAGRRKIENILNILLLYFYVLSICLTTIGVFNPAWKVSHGAKFGLFNACACTHVNEDCTIDVKNSFDLQERVTQLFWGDDCVVYHASEAGVYVLFLAGILMVVVHMKEMVLDPFFMPVGAAGATVAKSVPRTVFFVCVFNVVMLFFVIDCLEDLINMNPLDYEAGLAMFIVAELNCVFSMGFVVLRYLPFFRRQFARVMRYVDIGLLLCLFSVVFTISASIGLGQWVRLVLSTNVNPLMHFGPDINRLFSVMGMARNATAVEDDMFALDTGRKDYIELAKLSIGMNTVCYCKPTWDGPDIHWNDGVEFYSLMPNGNSIAFDYYATRLFAWLTLMVMLISFLMYIVQPAAFYHSLTIWVIVFCIMTLCLFTQASFNGLFPQDGTSRGHGYVLYNVGVLLSVCVHASLYSCFHKKRNT